MPRTAKFPITLKAGATAIRIYRNPLRVRHQNTAATSARAAKPKVYDSFLLAYYSGGQRVRKRFNTLAAAQHEADRVRALILNEDLVALKLSGQDQLAYVKAKGIADKHGLPVDLLAKEYDEARKILGDTSLAEAARFYQQFGRTIETTATVPQIVAELVAGLKADGLSDYHVRSTTQRLDRFAEAFPGPITEVHTDQITDWLRKLKGTDANGKAVELAAKTRNHYRNSVVHLFNYARDHKYLPKGMPTEAEAVKALSTVAPTNKIFTVEEMTTLLNKAPKHLVPALAIKAFTGIRTEEFLRITWANVKFATGYIVLDGEVTKTGERRMIPMSENLIAWLKPFEGTTGKIGHRWNRAQAFVQAMDRHGERLKIDVGANKFRNSYISYRVALLHDIQRVALESGNSPRVIQREYLELATEEDGKRWFGIMPDPKKLATVMEMREPPRPRIRVNQAKAGKGSPGTEARPLPPP